MKVRKVYNQYPFLIEFNSGLHYTHWEDMYQWCEKTYGKPGHPDDKTDRHWTTQWNGVRFKTEAQANWFILTWTSPHN